MGECLWEQQVKFLKVKEVALTNKEYEISHEHKDHAHQRQPVMHVELQENHYVSYHDL